MPRWVINGALAGLALACGGDRLGSQPTPEAQDPTEAADPAAAAVPMRRLTRAQYERSVDALLGPTVLAEVDLAARLPVDDRAGGFGANATAVTETVLMQYEAVAETLADAAVEHRASLHPCLASAVPQPECAAKVVDALGPRAFRRPLGDIERSQLVAMLWTSPPQDASTVDDALRRFVSALLQSPAFLYRVERGEPTDAVAVARLDAYEVASRLSFLVWDAPPDDELRAMAAEGRLDDAAGRLEVLEVLLADPRARDGLGSMHAQWLELDSLAQPFKDKSMFPAFNPAIGPLMLDEVAGFVDTVVRHGDGRLHTLLTSRTTVAPPGVVFWYGEDAEVQPDEPPPGSPAGVEVVALDPQRRAGLLTLVSVMAAHAKTDRSDPVGRGATIRQRVLCQPLAAPPPDTPPPPELPEPGASVREQLNVHSTDASCAACHDLIDPIGFTLEPYDAMGGWRSEDPAGNPIDARGRVASSDVEGKLDGPVALAESLAASAQVQDCYATQWWRYAHGRVESDADADTLASLREAFAQSDGHIPTLLRELVRSEAFVHRRSP